MQSKDALFARLYETTTRFDEEDVGNSFLQVELLDYVRTAKPRVLFVGYGETDNWAHQGRYDLVLESAHRTDAFIKELWETMQAMPQYRGTTTFIITADHGRGSGPVEWKEHGVEEKGSENVWIAVMGPDTAPLGERKHVEAVTQSQIAATIAALMGKDYVKDVPKAAQPIKDVLARGKLTLLTVTRSLGGLLALRGRPPVDAATAEAVAHELYGLTARATALDGERDRNFQLEAADGRRLVLKFIDHEADDVVVEGQSAALGAYC